MVVWNLALWANLSCFLERGTALGGDQDQHHQPAPLGQYGRLTNEGEPEGRPWVSARGSLLSDESILDLTYDVSTGGSKVVPMGMKKPDAVWHRVGTSGLGDR